MRHREASFYNDFLPIDIKWSWENLREKYRIRYLTYFIWVRFRRNENIRVSARVPISDFRMDGTRISTDIDLYTYMYAERKREAKERKRKRKRGIAHA